MLDTMKPRSNPLAAVRRRSLIAAKIVGSFGGVRFNGLEKATLWD
jgi:hypothetical protein